MTVKNYLSVFSISLLIWATSYGQAPLKERWIRPKATLNDMPAYLDNSRIVFKVAENDETNAPDYFFYDDQELYSKVTSILSNADYIIKPAFGTPKAKLLERRKKAQEMSGKQLSNLSLYYNIYLENCSKDERVTYHNEILMLDEIEIAYFPLKLLFEEEDKQPVNFSLRASPDFTSTQAYLKPAPMGIDAEYGWTFAGGKGANIQFCDVERDGFRDHEELLTPPINDVSTLTNYTFGNQHGTATISEVAADHDGSGIDGIAPDVLPMFSTICADVNCSTYDQAYGIDLAAQNMNAGDVMLLEVQTVFPSPFGAPIEYEQGPFDAIETATALGIIVVEAAGNGSNNLDQGQFLSLFDTTIRYSGAFIIGAAKMDASINGSTFPERGRLSFSTYGERIDFYGYGERVTCAGYGDLYGSSMVDYYTATFSGTSSASPIVAGACCIMQGIYKDQTSGTLPPWRLRDIFKATGTPSDNPQSDLIGVMPDLKPAIDTLMLIITSERQAQGLQTQQMNVYPNPSNGQFNIDSWVSDLSEYQLNVVDMLGNCVHRALITPSGLKHHEAIDINDQPAGIYFVKLSSSNWAMVKKIVKY